MKEYLEELKAHAKKFKKSSEVSSSEKYVYVSLYINKYI